MAYFFGDFVQVEALTVIKRIPRGIGENAFLYGIAGCAYAVVRVVCVVVRLQALQLVFIPEQKVFIVFERKAPPIRCRGCKLYRTGTGTRGIGVRISLLCMRRYPFYFCRNFVFAYEFDGTGMRSAKTVEGFFVLF